MEPQPFDFSDCNVFANEKCIFASIATAPNSKIYVRLRMTRITSYRFSGIMINSQKSWKWNDYLFGCWVVRNSHETDRFELEISCSSDAALATDAVTEYHFHYSVLFISKIICKYTGVDGTVVDILSSSFNRVSPTLVISFCFNLFDIINLQPLADPALEASARQKKPIANSTHSWTTEG